MSPRVGTGEADPEEDKSEEEKKDGILIPLLTFFGFVFIFIPITVMLMGAFFGAILAEVEGWKIKDGFYYIISMLCGLPTPLTEVDPDTDEGKLVDVIVALWALALAGTIIGVVGGLSVINRLVDAAESFGQRFKRAAKKAVTGSDEEAPAAAGEDGEVLQQQNCENEMPAPGGQLTALRQQLQHHRGRRKRQPAANGDQSLDREARRPGN